MSKRTSVNVHGFKGPTLQDAVGKLLEAAGYKGPQCQAMFGVGQTWYGDVFVRNKHEPSAAKLQEIYEVLSGEALIK